MDISQIKSIKVNSLIKNQMSKILLFINDIKNPKLLDRHILDQKEKKIVQKLIDNFRLTETQKNQTPIHAPVRNRFQKRAIFGVFTFCTPPHKVVIFAPPSPGGEAPEILPNCQWSLWCTPLASIRESYC